MRAAVVNPASDEWMWRDLEIEAKRRETFSEKIAGKIRKNVGLQGEFRYFAMWKKVGRGGRLLLGTGPSQWKKMGAEEVARWTETARPQRRRPEISVNERELL